MFSPNCCGLGISLFFFLPLPCLSFFERAGLRDACVSSHTFLSSLYCSGTFLLSFTISLVVSHLFLYFLDYFICLFQASSFFSSRLIKSETHFALFRYSPCESAQFYPTSGCEKLMEMLKKRTKLWF